MNKKALNKAIKFFGSQRQMAIALGIEPMTVTHWKRQGMPAKRAVQIEQVTNGHVTRKELLPDIFGDIIDE